VIPANEQPAVDEQAHTIVAIRNGPTTPATLGHSRHAAGGEGQPGHVLRQELATPTTSLMRCPMPWPTVDVTWW
jgi:hypothetical protein